MTQDEYKFTNQQSKHNVNKTVNLDEILPFLTTLLPATLSQTFIYLFFIITCTDTFSKVTLYLFMAHLKCSVRYPVQYAMFCLLTNRLAGKSSESGNNINGKHCPSKTCFSFRFFLHNNLITTDLRQD